MRTDLSLSPRLLCAASFVPDHARVIDVGTDHAYIPIWLVQNRDPDLVCASDINEGPLESARRNTVRYGVGDRIRLYISDGLNSCDYATAAYDHVLICGMGGELIASIIDSVPRSPEVTFILQPMTMQDKLRIYLSENGFATLAESLIYDGGKYYQVIVCRFGGEISRLSPLELLCGSLNLKRINTDENVRGYLERLGSVVTRKVEGMKKGGEDCAYDENILNEIRYYLNKEHQNEGN